jgi:hypothetical protein
MGAENCDLGAINDRKTALLRRGPDFSRFVAFRAYFSTFDHCSDDFSDLATFEGLNAVQAHFSRQKPREISLAIGTGVHSQTSASVLRTWGDIP